MRAATSFGRLGIFVGKVVDAEHNGFRRQAFEDFKVETGLRGFDGNLRSLGVFQLRQETSSP